MASWKKRLRDLLADPKGVGYTYSEVSGLLSRLGFQLHNPGRGGSHRKWRLDRDNRPPVIIGLVEKGHGSLPPGYIREAQRTILTEGLFPASANGQDTKEREID